MKLKLQECDKPGQHRQYTVLGKYFDIIQAIGFDANINEDHDKVEASWGFEDQHGRYAAIWCYKIGRYECERWSGFGDSGLLVQIFGADNVVFE